MIDAKSLNQLREVARKLHDELCWGNRKDIGAKWPRTPLTQEEYTEKSKALHEEAYVKVSEILEQLEQLRDFDFWQWLKTTYPDYNEDNRSDFKEMLQNFVKKELLARVRIPVRRIARDYWSPVSENSRP